MKAVKGNKEYSIDGSQQKSYQDAGFDIYDDDGILSVYGKGKTVPYGDYVKLKEELEAVMDENKNLKQLLAEQEESKTKKVTDKSGKTGKGTGEKDAV